MQSIQTQLSWYSRAQWSLLAVMVLCGTLFYLTAYRPAMQRLGSLKVELTSKKGELHQNQMRVQNLPVLAMEVSRLRERLDRFDKKLPRQTELGQFMKDITQLSQQTSLRRVTLQPAPPRRTNLFSELPIVMNFEGDYTSVASFLRQTESMQRLTRVRNLAIRSKDAKLGLVEVQVAMSIFFSEGQ